MRRRLRETRFRARFEQVKAHRTRHGDGVSPYAEPDEQEQRRDATKIARKMAWDGTNGTVWHTKKR